MEKLNKQVIQENNGIFHWEFHQIFRLLSKFEMKLRAAGRTQIRTLDSETSSRIASEVGQSIEAQSPRLGLADHWPYHLDGHSPRSRVKCATSFPCSIILMETRNGECSGKNRSFFGTRTNSRINSGFCPPGSPGTPEVTKEANWRSTGKYEQLYHNLLM